MGRGSLYEDVGVVRDVIQNHILSVIATLTMEVPEGGAYNDCARGEMVKLLRQISPIDPRQTVLGQVEGYRKEKGVSPDSETPTFAAMQLRIDSWRWYGVPFFVRAGKSLPATATEVRVKLKRPPLAQFSNHQGNYLRFRLSPEVIIAVGARVKTPGQALEAEPAELVFAHRDTGDEMTPYERLLGDAMNGDQTLFSCEGAVEAAWNIVGPALSPAHSNDLPLRSYAPGSWGPKESGVLANSIGGWINPG